MTLVEYEHNIRLFCWVTSFFVWKYGKYAEKLGKIAKKIPGKNLHATPKRPTHPRRLFRNFCA